MDKIKALYRKYQDILWYLLVGGVTTLIDIVVFALMNSTFGLYYQTAKAISTAAAIAVAFVGNKWLVFRTKSESRGAFLRELGSFVAMRLVTYFFSAAFLQLTIGSWQWDENLANIIANVVVIIANYVLSKLVVFRKTKKNEAPKG